MVRPRGAAQSLKGMNSWHMQQGGRAMTASCRVGYAVTRGHLPRLHSYKMSRTGTRRDRKASGCQVLGGVGNAAEGYRASFSGDGYTTLCVC